MTTFKAMVRASKEGADARYTEAREYIVEARTRPEVESLARDAAYAEGLEHVLVVGVMRVKEKIQ